jgi:hypothetical protein
MKTAASSVVHQDTVQHVFAYAVSALCHVCLSSKPVQFLYCLPRRLLLLLPLQGRVTISNDGATIMKLLDVVHPAAKTLVDVSLSQDAEVRAVVCSLVLPVVLVMHIGTELHRSAADHLC